MAAVTPTSTDDLTGKTARKQAAAAPKAVEGSAPKPTPTQEENDLASAGVHVDVHEWDGTPLQNKPPFVPPDQGGGPPGVTVPVISSLSPSSAVAGDPADITMVVNGSGFTPNTVIVMNNYDEPTTFGSESQVSTGVKPSLFVVPADVPVWVRNSSFVSNELTFKFTAAGTQQQAKKSK